MQRIAGAETDFVAAHADDAWPAGAEHLDADAAAKAELLEAMNVVGLSKDATDMGGSADGELAERDGAINHEGALEWGTAVRIS